MSLFHLPPSLRLLILPQIRQISTSTLKLPPEPLVTHPEPSLDLPLPPQPPLLNLTSSTLNSYTHTQPPSPSSLRSATTFFTRSPPLLTFSSPYFSDIPTASPYPEVAFLGRSNVGKSSLLNAIFNRTTPKSAPAHVSRRAGRTRSFNGFGISPSLANSDSHVKGRKKTSPGGGGSGSGGDDEGGGAGVKSERWKALGQRGLIVVDMPGYGGGSREDWGREAIKYLSTRKQLKRVFVLVDAEHGLNNSDVELLRYLRREGWCRVQLVLSKVDKILMPKYARNPGEKVLSNKLGKLAGVVEECREKVKEGTGGGDWLGDVLCFSAERRWEVEDERGRKDKRKVGVAELRFAVLSACGMENV